MKVKINSNTSITKFKSREKDIFEKEKKLISQKNILSKEDFEKKYTFDDGKFIFHLKEMPYGTIAEEICLPNFKIKTKNYAKNRTKCA